MRNLFVLAAVVGVLGFIGCKYHGHPDPSSPYVNKFLTGATQEGECVRIITKTPEGYIGYLTIDGNNEAAVLVFRSADETIDGIAADVEDVVICGLALGASHHLSFEIRSNDLASEAYYPPFGQTLTEVLDVFLEEVPLPPPPPTPERPTIVVNGVVITISGVVCDVQLSLNGVLVATFVNDGSTKLDLEPGNYTLEAQDCNGFIMGFTYVVPLPQDDPCTPSLTFLPRGGSTAVLTKRLQLVLDALHLGGKARLHATTDFIQEGLDAYWQINTPDGFGPTEGDVAALIVIELAAFKHTNTFGIYDVANTNNRIELFDGPAGAASGVQITIMNDGRVFVNTEEEPRGTFGSTRFGFYLDSSASEGGGLFFSESQLNPDHKDHMVAYQGDNDVIIDPPGNWPAEVFRSDEFILGFEDLVGLTIPSATLAGCIAQPPIDPCDWDYEDMVILISGIRPKPCE